MTRFYLLYTYIIVTIKMYVITIKMYVTVSYLTVLKTL